MQITPDAQAARDDELRVVRLVRAGLARVLPRVELPSEPEIAYPGYHAAAHRAHRMAGGHHAPSAEQLERLEAELLALGDRARASAARANERAGYGRWPVDLPPAEEHLTESLDRARAHVAQHPGRAAELAALAVTPWDAPHHRVFTEADRVLRRVWPAMVAELAVVVRQVALLDGWGIDGFTDFAVHGVVFVNSARVVTAPDSPSLPAPLPLVEALVYEGTQNRCDAAAVSEPFLTGAPTSTELPHAPLRSDPHPLAALFQQVVVLARVVLLYDRLLAAPQDTLGDARTAVLARRAVLAEQGLTDHAALTRQHNALTEHGRSLAAHARRLLERAAR